MNTEKKTKTLKTSHDHMKTLFNCLPIQSQFLKPNFKKQASTNKIKYIFSKLIANKPHKH
jgi:hypothetical protein